MVKFIEMTSTKILKKTEIARKHIERNAMNKNRFVCRYRLFDGLETVSVYCKTNFSSNYVALTKNI